MKPTTPLLLTACGLMIGLRVGLTAAATRTWSGPAQGDWFAAAHWTPAGVPAAGDTVVIDQGSLLLTDATAALASVAIADATVTFSNWTATLQAHTIDVLNNGILTHAAVDTNAAPGITNRVALAGRSITIHAGGQVQASSVGFREQQGPGAGIKHPDRGEGSGGGHGGRGGNSVHHARGGDVYGHAAAPKQPGSGGGHLGGAGGGLIRIHAPGGAVRVDGTVAADGQANVGHQSGGGAGGGILLICGRFEGNGVLRANGGTGHGTHGGGGGGGRIAIVYDPSEQRLLPSIPTPTLSVAGGTGRVAGEMGTLFFPDPQFLPPELTTMTGRIHFTNQDIIIPYPLIIGNRQVGFAPGQTLRIAGDLLLTNNAHLYLQAGWRDDDPAYGGLLDVGGTLTLAAGSRLFPASDPQQGGVVHLAMHHLNVQTGAAISADGAGYAGDYGPGAGRKHPTRGEGSGGGHGGRGGNSVHGAVGGDPHGLRLVPGDPGSGGGYSGMGGAGGGMIRIEASGGNVRHNGEMSANGQAFITGYAGGGAGGSILLVCRHYHGSGTLQANGGAGQGTHAGGGAGGRIAILRMDRQRVDLLRQGQTTGLILMASPPAGFHGTVTVNGGGPLDRAGEIGTIVFGFQSGSVIQLR